jgi:hypothetical protein
VFAIRLHHNTVVILSSMTRTSALRRKMNRWRCLPEGGGKLAQDKRSAVLGKAPKKVQAP